MVASNGYITKLRKNHMEEKNCEISIFRVPAVTHSQIWLIPLVDDCQCVHHKIEEKPYRGKKFLESSYLDNKGPALTCNQICHIP
jgi:hypothetical protein